MTRDTLLLSMLGLSVAIPLGAAPAGNAIISTADTLDKGITDQALSIIASLDRDSASEIVLNSHYGIGFGTDIGFDVPLNGSNRALFHATHRAWSTDATRIRLGALGIGSSGDENVELVLGHDVGETTLHAGVAHAFPGTVASFGLSRILSPSATLHAEYLGGPDAEAALGAEWSLGHGLALIVSGLHDFRGDASLFLDLSWTNAD